MISRITVFIPELVSTVTTDVRSNESVRFLINLVLNQVGIKDANDFHLFGVGPKYLEISPDLNCSPSLLSKYSSYILSYYNPSCPASDILIFYENRYASITRFANESLSLLMTRAVMVFNLNPDQEFYFFFDPETNKIIPLDCNLSYKSLVIKKSNLLVSPTIFSVSTFAAKNPMLLLAVSKQIFTPMIKKLFSLVRTRRTGPIEICKLDRGIIQAQLGLDPPELSDAEQNSMLLFLISSFGPLIPESIQRLLPDVFHSDSWFECFECAKAIVLLLPLENHCILAEICQCYGGVVDEDARNSQISVLRLLCFKDEIHLSIENKFIRTILTYHTWIFNLPQRPGRELFESQGNLVILDEGSYYDMNGSIEIENPIPYKSKPVSEALLIKVLQRSNSSEQPKDSKSEQVFEELNTEARRESDLKQQRLQMLLKLRSELGM